MTEFKKNCDYWRRRTNWFIKRTKLIRRTRLLNNDLNEKLNDLTRELEEEVNGLLKKLIEEEELIDLLKNIQRLNNLLR